MRNIPIAAAAVALALCLVACQSSKDKSVKTNYLSQWTMVNADVKTTTAAAQEVLNEMSLLEVKSSATNLDGMASGKKASGSKVEVSVTRSSDTMSKVSVSVGTMGDPSLGTDIARKVKAKAEGGATTKP
jgi:hypothetical protein